MACASPAVQNGWHSSRPSDCMCLPAGTLVEMALEEGQVCIGQVV
jgi:hypothetical protein